MKMNQDMYNDVNTRLKLVCGCLMASLIVMVILGGVMYLNKDALMGKKSPKASVVKTVSEDTTSENEIALGENTLTSDDLDFWHMYDKEEKPQEDSEDVIGPGMDKKTSYDNQTASENNIKASGLSENSLSADSISGNSFNIGNKENPEWVEIMENISKNNYAAGSFRMENNELQYYSNNHIISSFGIDVSKYQGDINWEEVKKDGVTFAMIRMGVRGYNSGSVVIDEKFTKNLEGALSQGIDVGIYFYSQAITPQEAVEEANYAVAAVKDVSITYPIVFYSEKIENDTARTDQLKQDQLTECAKYFCDTVKQYGYKPMIAASKGQLAKGMELQKLSGYDLWLIDPAEQNQKGKEETKVTQMSDFPYQYTMWQYQSNAKMNGVPENVNLDISFVDYKYR